MQYQHYLLIAEFKAIMAAGKAMGPRDKRFEDFMSAVKKTCQDEGTIQHLDEICEQFDLRLRKTNNWGKNLVVKELEKAIGIAVGTSRN